MEEESKMSEVGSGRSEVGSGRSEVGKGRSEVGSGRSEVGSGRSDAGHFTLQYQRCRVNLLHWSLNFFVQFCKNMTILTWHLHYKLGLWVTAQTGKVQKKQFFVVEKRLNYL
jgi:hypothetical protein